MGQISSSICFLPHSFTIPPEKVTIHTLSDTDNDSLALLFFVLARYLENVMCKRTTAFLRSTEAQFDSLGFKSKGRGRFVQYEFESLGF